MHDKWDDAAEYLRREAALYTCMFRMSKAPWTAGIIVFDNGEVKMNRQLIEPSRTLIIELEGVTANTQQVEMCRHIWAALSREFPFELSVFGEGVVQHSAYILMGVQ